MRALVQRVSRASVRVDGGDPRAVGRGLLILVGVGRGDGETQARRLAEKALNLSIFSNADGRFDRSVLDEKGEVLVVSQFTLYGDPWTGRRPDFLKAEDPKLADPLYRRFVEHLAASGLTVRTGEFGAAMQVESVNDGPVTIWLDTNEA